MTEQRLRASLRKRTEQLLWFLHNDAPDNVTAMALRLVVDNATAVFGADLYAEFGKRAVTDARQRFGVCQDCDTDINAHLTHPPICETCDARQQAEFDRMDADQDAMTDEEKESVDRICQRADDDEEQMNQFINEILRDKTREESEQ